MTDPKTTEPKGLDLGTPGAPNADPKPEVKAEPAPKAPETYSDWKLPDGYTLDPEAAAEVGPLFKELNLSQDQAQKLIDTYAKHSIKSSEDAMNAWLDKRKEWRDGLKTDEVLGKLVGKDGNHGPDSPLSITINKALDGLGNPKLVADFKDTMDMTGAGDAPAFVRVLYALASKLTEGTTHVAGNPTGRDNQGRPTPGGALYPHLPSRSG